MKNVAATNGQSVSFAALFFGVESTWEGIWAGTDMLLNFYARPPWAQPALVAAVEQTRTGRIQGLHLYASKKCARSKNFLPRSHEEQIAFRPWSSALLPVIDSPRLRSSNSSGASIHESVLSCRSTRFVPIPP